MSLLYPFVLLLWLPLLWSVWRQNGEGDGPMAAFRPDLYAKMHISSGMSAKRRRHLLTAAAFLAVLALARPVLDNGTVRVKQSGGELVVAFDISRSMLADDVYPNRLRFAKKKFSILLHYLKSTDVGVIAFSRRAFLVAPPTRDYGSLRYLVEHMQTDDVSARGTDLAEAVRAGAGLLKKGKNRALLLFTDGGDGDDLNEAIKTAKEAGIRVYVYAVATPKGVVLRLPGGLVRDARGEPVITRLNSAVKKLADETGGVYRPYSLSKKDMALLAKTIEAKWHGAKREREIRKQEELYIYPLGLALILFLTALSSLPERKRSEA